MVFEMFDFSYNSIGILTVLGAVALLGYYIDFYRGRSKPEDNMRQGHGHHLQDLKDHLDVLRLNLQEKELQSVDELLTTDGDFQNSVDRLAAVGVLCGDPFLSILQTKLTPEKYQQVIQNLDTVKERMKQCMDDVFLDERSFGPREFLTSESLTKF